MVTQMMRRVIITAVTGMIALSGYCQKIASLEVRLSQPAYGLEIPVSVDLDAITFMPDTLLDLYEVSGKSRIYVPFQIEPGDPRKLHWIIIAGNKTGEKHIFELVKGKREQEPTVTASAKDGILVIHKGDQNLLQYYFKTVYPPEGVDTAYKRSGFIHPLWSPRGQVLTSEGRTRKDADGSKARWCIVQGEIDGDYAGIVMMSYPTNYNFPEPLRIWPENQYNRGDMFANFCPTKDMDWLLLPRRNYVLKYRFLVFNGKVEKEKARSAWFYFANPPKVTVKLSK